jgi:ATP-dependent Clp protease adapter protein ClpS
MTQPPVDGPRGPRLPGDVPAQPDRPSGNHSRSVPRYKVVLHHKPTYDLMFVVRSVMELTRFPRAEATHKMWEAYHSGHSVLLTTYLERAELYADQFAGRGLTVTVEPV